jgi:energy-coupling factor transporter ATP-binding protein EcfA2
VTSPDIAATPVPAGPLRIVLPPAWWGVATAEAVPPFRPLAALVADGVLDAELAAVLWLLVEAGIPVTVAGPRGSGRSTLLAALLACLAPDTRPVLLAGEDEDFGAVPEAVELGWRRERGGERGARAGQGRTPRQRPDPRHTVLLAAELGDVPPLGIWGDRARVAIRALTLGYGLATTIEAAGLDAVFASLRGPAVGAGVDELAGLGLVVVLARRDPGAAPVATAAHYVRPLVRDPHGHVQRMPPAVLAARDARDGRWSHFAWGLTDELAGRLDRRPLELEREAARRGAAIAAAARGERRG